MDETSRTSETETNVITQRFIVVSKSRANLYAQIGELSFPEGTNFAGEWQLAFTRIGNIPEPSNTLNQKGGMTLEQQKGGMTLEQKEKIDAMDYFSMIHLYRTAAAGHPMFAGEAGTYFVATMKEKGEQESWRYLILGPDAYVGVSKSI